uniref:transcriptional regulator domain-containing protein n=1 Tax=Sphingomonas sp. GlSt437 TaxID=3389970 RepID=UPI003A841CF7
MRPDAPGRPEFAAEFLRRNRRYRTEHDAMMRRIKSGHGERGGRLGGTRPPMGVILSPMRPPSLPDRWLAAPTSLSPPRLSCRRASGFLRAKPVDPGRARPLLADLFRPQMDGTSF